MTQAPIDTFVHRLAYGLYTHLHSAAGENIVSSLISAAFNESQDFRMALLTLCGGDGRWSQERWRAVTNYRVPAWLHGRSSGEDRKFVAPDIWCYDASPNKLNDWKMVEDNQYIRGENFAGLASLFIELKWDYLREKEARRICDLAERGTRASTGIRTCVITSIEPFVLSNLASSKTARQYNVGFVKLKEAGIKVITFRDVKELAYTHVSDSIQSPFTSFLSAYLEQVIDGHLTTDWWVGCLDLVNRQEWTPLDAKSHFIDCIRRISRRCGIQNEFKVAETRAKRVQAVDVHNANITLTMGTSDSPLVEVIGALVDQFDFREFDPATVAACLKRLQLILEDTAEIAA